MTVQSVLLPVFAQIALTFFLMVWMARTRFAAVGAGHVTIKDLKRDWTSWPERPTQIAAAYHNQFELPVLFYVVVLAAIITTQADFLFVILSWFFVVARLIHAYVHTGKNEIRARFKAFLLGAILLIVLWVYFFLKLFIGL
ncbi:hypothetical protein IZ6_15520 [Terrihabitans soli]|uniref:MAPEG family protein n=1 Tax=Terrihabitans soli TaxID=708113 RepID=A0A6S6QSA7_9HYPH|nr:MAPEG family protein [Terrihabitans soli]BCJ90817.1 hypothetical protein IZ6_15520 [Terrihabitans soli]